MQIGLGQLRLSPSAFYDMTFEDFCYAAQGMALQVHEQEKQEWERVRWLAAVLLQPHAKKGTRIKPTDIAKFPWDKKRKNKEDNAMLANVLKQWANG